MDMKGRLIMAFTRRNDRTSTRVYGSTTVCCILRGTPLAGQNMCPVRIMTTFAAARDVDNQPKVWTDGAVRRVRLLLLTGARQARLNIVVQVLLTFYRFDRLRALLVFISW